MDSKQTFINKLINVIVHMKKKKFIDDSFMKKVKDLNQCRDDSDYDSDDYGSTLFNYFKYEQTYNNDIFNEIIKNSNLSSYFVKFENKFELTSNFMLMLYTLHNMKFNYFEFFHKRTLNTNQDIVKFLVMYNKDKIKELDDDLFEAIKEGYIKELKKYNSLRSIYRLFLLHHYRGVEMVLVSPFNGNIYDVDEKYIINHFKDIEILKKFHNVVKNDKLTMMLVLKFHDDIKIFEEFCDLLSNINNINYLYYSFLDDFSKHDYIKILVKKDCVLPMKYIERHNGYLSNFYFSLETILLLESLENYDEFLVNNKEFLLKSYDEEVENYLNNVL